MEELAVRRCQRYRDVAWLTTLCIIEKIGFRQPTARWRVELGDAVRTKPVEAPWKQH